MVEQLRESAKALKTDRARRYEEETQEYFRTCRERAACLHVDRLGVVAPLLPLPEGLTSRQIAILALCELGDSIVTVPRGMMESEQRWFTDLFQEYGGELSATEPWSEGDRLTEFDVSCRFGDMSPVLALLGGAVKSLGDDFDSVRAELIRGTDKARRKSDGDEDDTE